MKLITILENVAIPGTPSFKKGQQVRVCDRIADLLVKRKHAKLERGKSRDEVKKAKVKKEKPSVKVERVGEK